jgi:hypothetical protein
LLRRILILLAALAACPAPTVRPPRLVVLLVVDQLPSWSFTARAPYLTHGLGRLLREGAYFPAARYPFAATYTAVGHSALATGAPPAVTGIIANEWWDRGEARVVEAVGDDGYPELAVNGWRGELDMSRPRVSPWRLRVPGIADALHDGTGGKGRSVGVSVKSRAAVLATGRRADLALWYDEVQRDFTTSTWYRKETPGWLAALAREHPIGPRLADDWVPLDARLLERIASVPDDAPGEAVNTLFGATFPHRPRALENPATALKNMPLGDTVTVEAALAAVDGEGLGKDDVPDYLVVSFSAHDYVGHTYGQESWEELDLLLRLDVAVGQLLDGLEARAGAGRVAVVLTSDHGAPRMIEAAHAGVRVHAPAVVAAADAATAPILGFPGAIDGDRDPTLYLSERARAAPAEVRERALDAAVAAVQRVPGIGYAFRSDRACASDEPRAAAVCRSIDPERSGELFFGPAPGSMIEDKEGDPIAHGSSNDEDALVPVIVWAAGVRAGRHEAEVSALQVAPTLAHLLRVKPPAAALEPPLPLD